jgi:hypothetical protein
MTEQLVANGVAIGYGLVGVLALLGLLIVQLLRRRADVKKAREAHRLASLSVQPLRAGPIAVTGKYRSSNDERWLECSGQRVVIDAPPHVVAGTRARWRAGTRTYMLRDRDDVIAIGVMAMQGTDWHIATSPGEPGVQLFAARPRPAPPPLFPWRAPLILALCGGIAFGALYGTGSYLVDTKCTADTRWRLEVSAALPLVRDQALAGLTRCR